MKLDVYDADGLTLLCARNYLLGDVVRFLLSSVAMSILTSRDEDYSSALILSLVFLSYDVAKLVTAERAVRKWRLEQQMRNA